MKQLTVRQAAFLIVICMASTKFLVVPSGIASFVGKDAWLVTILLFLFEIIPIIAIIAFMKKYPDKNFCQILEEVLGKIPAKIIIIFYAILIFGKLLLLNKETHNFLSDSLYDRVYWNMYFIPIVLIMGYIGYKGLKVMGRLSEMLILPIVIAFVMALFIGALNADLSNILPVMSTPAYTLFSTAFKATLEFDDFLILLVFMGSVKPEKKMSKKFVASIGIFMIATVIFMILFIAVNDNIALSSRQAISDIAQYIPGISSILKLDWITATIWISVSLLSISLMIYACYIFVLWALGLKKSVLVYIGICVALYFISILPELDVEFVIKVLYSQAMQIVGLIQYVVPYLLPLFMLIMDKKKKNQKITSQPLFKKKVQNV